MFKLNVWVIYLMNDFQNMIFINVFIQACLLKWLMLIRIWVYQGIIVSKGYFMQEDS